MFEFKVGPHSYRGRPLTAMEQFDVARKWSPLLIWLSGDRAPDAPPLTPEAFARGFCAVSAGIPKSDNDMAVLTCLGSTQRVVAGDAGQVPVLGTDGQVRHSDIDLGAMLQIVFHVLTANRLIEFFSAPPATSGTQGAGGTSPQGSRTEPIG